MKIQRFIQKSLLLIVSVILARYISMLISMSYSNNCLLGEVSKRLNGDLMDLNKLFCLVQLAPIDFILSIVGILSIIFVNIYVFGYNVDFEF